MGRLNFLQEISCNSFNCTLNISKKSASVKDDANFSAVINSDETDKGDRTLGEKRVSELSSRIAFLFVLLFFVFRMSGTFFLCQTRLQSLVKKITLVEFMKFCPERTRPKSFTIAVNHFILLFT